MKQEKELHKVTFNLSKFNLKTKAETIKCVAEVAIKLGQSIHFDTDCSTLTTKLDEDSINFYKFWYDIHVTPLPSEMIEQVTDILKQLEADDMFQLDFSVNIVRDSICGEFIVPINRVCFSKEDGESIMVVDEDWNETPLDDCTTDEQSEILEEVISQYNINMHNSNQEQYA